MTTQRYPRGVRRVLMTADATGPTLPLAFELARGLFPHDMEICLASMGATLSRRQWTEADGISNLRVFESDFKVETMDSPWEDLRKAGRWLLQLEESLAPDLIHLNGLGQAGFDFKAPVLVDGHACAVSRARVVGAPVGDGPPGLVRYREEARLGLHRAGLVVAPTRAMLGELEASFGPIKHKRVVTFGRAPSRFPPLHKQEYVLGLGGLDDPALNLAALDRIAGELLWPAYAAFRGPSGQEESRDGSRTEARAAGGLQSLGRLEVDEMASWYGHASIFALPARHEPLSLSVLEAGLAGCALVLGDIPSLRELWEGAAVFIPPDDPGLLRDALNTLIIDSPLRKRFAVKARTRALKFNPGRMAEQWRGAYFEVLRRTLTRAAV